MSTQLVSPGVAQLLWFVRIVDAGSFAEAARRSGITTSAVSKAISRFEKAHGVRLLHRTTHSLSLTDEGERLLLQARGLLDEVHRLEASLDNLGKKGFSGRVRLSAPTAFVRRCVMPELPRFLRDHPEISLEIQSSDEFVDLAAGGFDLAVRTGGLDAWPGYIARQLYSFPWIACAAPGYLEAHGLPKSPDDLAGHTLVGYRNRGTGLIDAWRFRSPDDGSQVSRMPQARHVFDDGEAAWEMVRSGMGIGWAPAWLGLADLRSGAVVEILGDWRTVEAPLSAVRLEGRLTPQRTRTVIEFLAGLSVGWSGTTHLDSEAYLKS